MNQIKTILVGVDFSECSRCALEQAVRLARWNNANLRIIHVLDPATLDVGGVDLPPEVDTVRRLHREQTIAWLAEWAEAAGAPPGHSREVMNGVPLDVLLQESRSLGANLLVLGVTGESLLAHGTGTVATKCLRKAGTKVLLVHRHQAIPFRRVLACVDFSDLSRAAVVQAVRVAEHDHAEVHVLHIFRAEWQRWGVRGQLPALADFERNYQAALKTSLRNFAGDVPRPGAINAIRQAKTHAAGIAEYAREVGADLIVLGTKGRTNLGYVMLGSTVERLLKEIPCSVLVVRTPATPAE